MSNEKEEWSEIEVPHLNEESTSVEYELEEVPEEINLPIKEEVSPSPESEEVPQELEGIETKGAQKG